MKLSIAQINATVGDFAGNAAKILEYVSLAKKEGSELVVFPELAVTGYPPEDLLLKPKFIKDNLACLKSIAGSIKGITACVGFVDQAGKSIYNACAVISEGRVSQVYRKIILPNYGVFDEKRYFSQGEKPLVIDIAGIKLGLNICEDIWFEEGPAKQQSRAGAKAIITLNASPYHAGKVKEREAIIQKQAKSNGVSVIYANMVGGQDELVFDGYSMAVDGNGTVAARAEGFKEELLTFELSADGKISGGIKAKRPEPAGEVYAALTLGVKDYFAKNGFKKAVIGLSGGIDSAIVSCIAVDALGRENVTCVFMPSEFSSNDSLEDARVLAGNLGIKFLEISIQEIFKEYLSVLNPHFEGKHPDITEENLQARIRGNYMMALSNKFGWLVLTTGNKSEMSTGYATLYGDMAGGFAVIKDVPKLLVYAISEYRNSVSTAIPRRILTKAPTAELRHNQKDSDSLPPYEILDPILKLYVEEDRDAKEIVAEGFEEKTVYRVLGLVDRSEYKRRQSPPGVKITPKAFGRDRRVPITNKYKS